MDSKQHTLEMKSQLVSELFVSDVKVSVLFYTKLGFKLLRETPGFAVVGWDDAILFLDQRPSLSPQPVLRSNIRIMVNNVDHYWNLVRDDGDLFRIAAPVEDRYYGLRDFTIVDPDGFGIRFASPVSGD